MPMVRSGFVNQAHLADEIAKAIPKLGPDVVRVGHSVGTDTSGDPSVFFRIVLSDQASREETLPDVSGRIVGILFEEIRPYEDWGLTPYFSFRSKSEQSTRNEPEWS